MSTNISREPGTLGRLVRFWETLRHLKPIQFYGRLWFRLACPRPDLRAAPALRETRGRWLPSARREPSLLAPTRFRFLNCEADLADVGWDDPARDKLWRYNQHYFDDLNAAGAPSRRDWHRSLMIEWTDHNFPGVGSGWEPYPTSLRIVNWVKWALAGNALPPDCLQSLAVQARWLKQRLEWHLLGNHLFANAKALVFAGLFFDGGDAERWLETGLRVLARELPEQVLADGGQFELSPMYHALAIEDVLDLINVLRTYGSTINQQGRAIQSACEVRVPSMQHWLKAMCHPDGEIALFNDAAIGIAPAPSELAAYALRLGFGLQPVITDELWLADSGYARLKRGDAVLIADMARVGPDYLLGHAHADTLSFEFSFGTQRVFVNGGTSVYGTGPERLRQRGTAAHNTVTVAGQNSSEVWSGFRVGRRAYPFDASVECEGDALVAQAAHDGYRYLPGRPVHSRRWRLSLNKLEVEDHLSNAALPAEARFHLHPVVRCQQGGEDNGTLILPDGSVLGWRAPGHSVSLEANSWHPEFGISLPNWCLVLPLRNGRASFELNWS